MCDFACVPAICRAFVYNNQPFTVQLPYWHRSLGLFLLILSFIVYNAGERAKGYIDGMKEGERIVIELLKKKTE